MSGLYRLGCKGCGKTFSSGEQYATLCAACDPYKKHRRDELARLRAPRPACARCGALIEIDRPRAATCLKCRATGPLDDTPWGEQGAWRVGPVVFDWSGLFSAARCERCPSFSLFRFEQRCDKTAILHAKYCHGYDGDVVKIPESVSTDAAA